MELKKALQGLIIARTADGVSQHTIRNCGGIYTLQRILGDSFLEMVKRYPIITKEDCEIAHRKASPVDNREL